MIKYYTSLLAQNLSILSCNSGASPSLRVVVDAHSIAPIGHNNIDAATTTTLRRTRIRPISSVCSRSRALMGNQHGGGRRPRASSNLDAMWAAVTFVVDPPSLRRGARPLASREQRPFFPGSTMTSSAFDASDLVAKSPHES